MVPAASRRKRRLQALLPGVAVIGAMLCANRWIAGRTFACQQSLLAARDARVRLVRELFGAIKALKLHAWEGKFGERVSAARESELSSSARIIRLRALLAAAFTSTPIAFISSSFSWFTRSTFSAA